MGAWAWGDLWLWAWVLLACDLGWVGLWGLPLGSGGWLACCALLGGFGSEHEHPFVRVCSWGLFPGGMVGGSAAWVLGGLLRLCLSRVAGWGSPVQCLRLWVALGLGVGGVAGAFVLLNRPCYHDINIKELKFL